jgi:sugar-specific transcriptional regulator TrmB
VSVSETVELLRQRFDQRFERLGNTLDELESVGQEAISLEGNVWSTTGTDAITSRMIQFLDAATDEIVLVVGGSKVLSENLFDRLSAAAECGVKLYVGTLAVSNHEEIHAAVPEAQLFESELDWLQPDDDSSDEHRIGRLLLVDREMLLRSSIGPDDSTDTETAIWSDNVGNGLIVIARRLLATGLDSRHDEGGVETPPGTTD